MEKYSKARKKPTTATPTSRLTLLGLWGIVRGNDRWLIEEQIVEVEKERVVGGIMKEWGEMRGWDVQMVKVYK